MLKYHSVSFAHSAQNQPLITFFVLMSFSILLYASFTLSYPNTSNDDIVSQHYFVEPQKPLSLQEVLALGNKPWKDTSSLNLGSSTKAHWIKVALNHNDSFERRILSFDDMLIDDVEAWFVDGDNTILSSYRFGDRLPFSSRPISSGSFIMEIPQVKGELQLLMRAQTSVVLNLNVRIWNTPAYLEYMSDLSLFHGVVFGYIFALFSYSVMMYATSRNRQYSIYAAYLLSFSLHLASITGHGYHYLWSNSPNFQQSAAAASVSAMMLFLLLFTREVLQLKSKSNAQANVIKWQLGASFVIIAACLLYPQPVIIKLAVLSLIVNGVLGFAVCASLLKGGKAKVSFFTLIWSIVVLAIIVSILERFKLLFVGLEPSFIITAGFAIQTLLMGVALINLYRKNQHFARNDRELALQKEKEMLKAKDELILTQRFAQEKLERQVQAQTAQLENALLELSSASAELKHLRNVDGLTGLPNRHVFDEHVNEVIERCIAKGNSIAIALLDLDHFKQVNDEHGHLAGDHALKVFAEILKSKLSAPDCFACRFGGEEFVALSENKSLEEMTHLMEDVRLCFENTLIEYHEKSFRCTVSIGLAFEQALASDIRKEIIAKADSRLYLAKQQGRNQVVWSN